jgi:catechol 2,3-dioxygenase-like lactoylglutathione lyase family enzyme
VIDKLHHSAYRCRDSEETRRFYEDFLGLPLVLALPLTETKTGRDCHALHTFFRLADGSFLAFFEVPGLPFDFAPRDDFDLHLALEVDYPVLRQMLQRARELGIESRGVSDHGPFHSVYFRDPNGYVIELTAAAPGLDAGAWIDGPRARAALDRWQAQKVPG